MRFFCEWCHQRVRILDGHRPYAEVLDHFSHCAHRSLLTSDQQVAGLAAHITGLIAGPRENRMLEAG